MYAPGVEPKVRDTSRRADASAMRSPSGEAVSVRLFSQVVVGTAAAIADRKSKLQQMASSAIGERRELVAREQAMAGRSGVDKDEDEDDDDMFVLDPSLPFSICASQEVRRGPPSLTQSAPMQRPFPVESGRRAGLDGGARPVPFLRVTLGGVRQTTRAITLDCGGHVGAEATVAGGAGNRGGHAGSCSLCCAASTTFFSLTQTSTTGRPWVLGAVMGRQLSGRVADGALRALLGPSRSRLGHPSAEASHKDEYILRGGVAVGRPLAHLFRPAPDFSGAGPGVSLAPRWAGGRFTPVSMTPEAALRLGDHYTTFSIQKLVVQAAASTTVPRPEGGREANMPHCALAPQKPR